ncbi:unnamed protein product, partial [Rotaria magnacalcarata]
STSLPMEATYLPPTYAIISAPISTLDFFLP